VFSEKAGKAAARLINTIGGGRDTQGRVLSAEEEVLSPES